MNNAQTQNDTQTKRYSNKYKYLKMRVRSLILENAALCDEVAKIQESIVIVKDERKFLLHKLLECENDADISQFFSRNESVPINGSKSKPKKRQSLEDSK
ncbi:hypothetical protein K1T71_008740 [Dendrolimus kikuchii]|uniref:Uncharacterized protein n=1 Tax=Dendrolimus kikuchii TaxID=765133 RepID=A0ACC1CVH1_9NEOP|nr:hypothetical protein K1T71_008740 [Dendrolimus kikuchii]